MSCLTGREVGHIGRRLPRDVRRPSAIRCALSIRDAVQALGIQVRAGLHTGECEIRVQLREDPGQPGICRPDLDITILAALPRHSQASRVKRATHMSMRSMTFGAESRIHPGVVHSIEHTFEYMCDPPR
jgi:hypothetical protein